MGGRLRALAAHVLAVPLYANAATSCCLTHRIPVQSRGADPSIRTDNYDPYLDPGKKLPVEVSSMGRDGREWAAASADRRGNHRHALCTLVTERRMGS